MNRRALLAAALALAAAPAMADPPHSFDGTWGGAEGQVSAQVIVLNGAVIGFYWNGDYTDGTNARVSDAGRVMSFDFAGGSVTLTRTGDATAVIEVTERAKVSHLDLKRD